MTTSSNLRPIDQLDNEDDRSRLRVSKACARCRIRKDRCDGLHPCTACSNVNHTCAYEVTTKKRGLPEGYVRGLEKLLTLACCSIDGLDDVLISFLHEEEVRKSWNSAAGDEIYTKWKDSRVHRDLELFLQNNPANAATCGTGTKRKRARDDGNGNFDSESPSDQLGIVIQLLREQQHRIAQGTSIPPNVAHEVSQDTQDGVPTSTEDLPANSKELLDLYFLHVHCWFPVLDRPTVLKTYYGQSRRMPQQKPNGGQALLWAIFAYTVVIESKDQELSRRYSETCLKHIPTPNTNTGDLCDFDDMHAQALLVLALLRLGNGQWLDSWNCSGRAVRIILAKQSTSLKATLQGCFILETLLNVHFDNSRSLFPASLVSDLINEDGHEEWETWGGSHSLLSSSVGPSFALSIFNRLTKVFLILHEALTNPRSCINPAYVQSKLSSVHALAQEHFAAGIPTPTLLSAPHHLYFQIGLLLAQLRLVSGLAEESRTQFDLASLATNVLGLFEIAEKSPNSGLTQIPPLFADILNLASSVAAEVKESFDISASSTSYRSFASTILGFRVRLTSVWTSFRSPNAEENSSATNSTPSRSAQRTEAIPLLPDGYDFALPDRADFLAPDMPTPNVPNQWSPAPLQDTRNDYSQISWRASSLTCSNQNYSINPTGFPTASPSFAGDEIDAIFHEMAHLDTNEWTSERTLGLRDFGFNDESAFMEFCNDPERLGMPVDSNVPLSSTRQSWAFATQPP